MSDATYVNKVPAEVVIIPCIKTTPHIYGDANV